jgi:tungstate transport system substrate-binding protein
MTRAGVGLAALCLLLAAPGAGAEPAEARLLLATTTSVRDSGLLDEILPLFTEETGVRVQAVAVGTGAALRMGAEGNADALLTHAPAGEEALVASGAAVSRRTFMENYFVIVGPAEDPAAVASAETAAAAFRRMRDAGSPYVSRGDDSGTHRREVEILRAAGVATEGWKGFMSTGSGMGLALQVAGERRAYTLSDVGTFRSFQSRIGLVALSRPEAALRNPYSLVRINPERFPSKIRAQAAQSFERFLVRRDIQQRIGEFGKERFGDPLFSPLLLGSASPRP